MKPMILKADKNKITLGFSMNKKLKEQQSIYPPINLLLKMKIGDTIRFGNKYYGGKKHWTIKRDK